MPWQKTTFPNCVQILTNRHKEPHCGGNGQKTTFPNCMQILTNRHKEPHCGGNGRQKTTFPNCVQILTNRHKEPHCGGNDDQKTTFLNSVQILTNRHKEPHCGGNGQKTTFPNCMQISTKSPDKERASLRQLMGRGEGGGEGREKANPYRSLHRHCPQRSRGDLVLSARAG